MKVIEVRSGGDYECGFRCDLSGDPHKLNVCEKKQK